MNYFKLLPKITTTAIILLILYLTYLVLQPFLYVLIVSFILVIFLAPLYEWFVLYLKKPAIAAVVTIVLLLFFILLPLFFVLGSVVSEARGLLLVLQDKPTLLGDAQNYIAEQLKYYGLPVDTTELELQEQAVGVLKTTIQNIGGTLLYAGSFLLDAFFVLITTFFFLLQKKKIKEYFMKIQFMSDRHFTRLQERTVEMVNGVVRGNLFVVIIQIIVGAVGFLLFGLPAPILLGVLYGLLSLVPVIGGLLIWVPVSIILFFTQGVFATILFIAWFVITNFLVDSFIAPKIIGSQTKLHQLLIMFSVVGGVQTFGIVGIVLGPIIIALAFVAVEMYKEIVEESKKVL